MTKNILLTEVMGNDVNNEEIKLKILRTLYDKYFEGQIDTFQKTEDVIKESALDGEERNVIEGNLVYLYNDQYIYGIQTLVEDYPRNIKITSSGIDFVEDHVPELQDFHNAIRFRVLAILHGLHFGGNIGKAMNTDMMAKELVVFGGTEDDIRGDVNYLHSKGFIWGREVNGIQYPDQVMILNPGIDVVDSIAEQSINGLEQADLDSETQAIVSEIKQSDKKGRVEKLKELYESNKDSARQIIVETIKQAIIRAFRGDSDLGSTLGS